MSTNDAMPPALCYAGIGNRELPPLDAHMMAELATELERNGWHLASGGAVGSDAAFADGVQDRRNATIWLPWNNFNGMRADRSSVRVVGDDGRWRDMEHLAQLVTHPRAWQALGRAQPLFVRNAAIIARGAGDRQVDAVVCWNASKNKNRGGTNHAIRVAEKLAPAPALFNLVEQSIDQVLARLSEIARNKARTTERAPVRDALSR